MNGLDTVAVSCPYCGETLELLVDCSEAEQRYVEDCQICCRPMRVVVAVVADGAEVSVYSEDE